MVINLSEETIQTVCNSLRDSKRNLMRQLDNEKINHSKKEIVEYQLKEVEYALEVFDELLDSL